MGNYFGAGNNNPNLLFNNTFNNLDKSIVNNSNNGSSSSGLTLVCNTFNNSVRDIVSLGDLPTQGKKEDPAGNSFFYNDEVNGDIGYFSTQLEYFYGDNGTQEPLQHNLTGGLSKISLSTDNSKCISPEPPIDPFPNPWATPYTTPAPPITPWNGIHNDPIPTCTWTYNWPPIGTPIPVPTCTMILTQLQPFSPNLPINIMHQLFEYSTSFTEAQITQVLVQNPALILDDYIGWVVLYSGSFSQANINMILNAYNQGDNRIRSYQAWTYYNRLRASAARHNCISFLKHGLPITEIQYREQMAYNKDFKAVYAVLKSYIREENYTGFNLKLNSTAIADIKDNAVKQEFIKYKEIMNIMIPFYMNKINPSTMTPQQKSIITSIANYDYGIATDEARHILHFYFNEYFPPVSKVNWYQGISFRSNVRSKEAIINKGFSCYPNPASDRLFITYNGDDDTDANYKFVLFDALGRQVYTIDQLQSYNDINIDKIGKGFYWYQIIDHQGKVFQSQNVLLIN
ncbi:MAG: Secretion system C-terminal sorting domain [Bacteroidota bacterium]